MQLASNNGSAVKFRDAVNRAFSFSLSSTGYSFTKVVRVLGKYWRSHGIPVIVNLVDGWVCDPFQMCKSVPDSIQNTLSTEPGFVWISYESGKCNVRISCSL